MKIEHPKIFRGPSKILKNISWPINIYLKYFMAPTKTLWPPPPLLHTSCTVPNVSKHVYIFMRNTLSMKFEEEMNANHKSLLC